MKKRVRRGNQRLQGLAGTTPINLIGITQIFVDHLANFNPEVIQTALFQSEVIHHVPFQSEAIRPGLCPIDRNRKMKNHLQRLNSRLAHECLPPNLRVPKTSAAGAIALGLTAAGQLPGVESKV